MTRNLVICMVPTVLAFFAIYWLKRRKKSRPISDLPPDSGQQEKHKSSLECASSSDLDNTISDDSSFSSPISSEKSSETDSPLFDSPLHVVDGGAHSDLVLPNCTENSYACESKDFLRIEDLTNSVLAAKQPFGSESLNVSKYKTLRSPSSMEQSVDFFESDDLFLSESVKGDQSTNKLQTLDFNSSFEIKSNNSDDCLQKNVVECENLDNLTALLTAESEKAFETDCHSSAFDENSLSYVSDDSESKQFADCKNKGSLSSVLDENSLLSSFCDELEKSSASNSPIAITSKLSHFENCGSDSPKDVLDLLSFKESSINLQNYSDSYANSLKESNLDKNIEESSIHVNNSLSPDSSKSYKIIFENESMPFGSEAFESNVGLSDLGSFNPEKMDEIVDSSNIEPVQNNLSDIKELTSNDELTSDSKTLNIDGALEMDVEQLSQSVGTEASSDIISRSMENGYNKMASFSENKTSVNSATYASILNSNRNKSSSDAATCIVRPISSELTSSPTSNFSAVHELLKSSLNWPLPNSKPASGSNSDLHSTSSKQTFSTMNNEPPKGCCEIKTNSDSTAADKNSTKFHQKDNLLESSNEEHKITKQCKLEINGFFDQKTSVMQSSKEFVYEFELPQELCGRLIGKHGRNVKSIMEHSNANVFIKHHPYDPLLKVVVVEGHRADVNEALEIIRRKYPPSMFPAVTLVQTNILSSTGVPMPESLQLHLPEGASCDVILSSLVSAGHFFLQQPTHPTYPSLSTLDQCMINLYSQMDTPHLPQPIEAGVICAAPVYRGWYRAQVVYVCDNSSDCGIKFVDYGGFSQVPISSLRQIRSDFMSLPFQASECYLAQVRPLGGDTWSSEANSVFEELAQGQILQALLVEYADDGIPCVHLYRVQGVSSTFINKELVERGLAEWVGNSNHWDPH